MFVVLTTCKLQALLFRQSSNAHSRTSASSSILAADAAPAPAPAVNEDATAGADEKPLGENCSGSAPKRGFVPKGDGKRVQVCCVAVVVP